MSDPNIAGLVRRAMRALEPYSVPVVPDVAAKIDANELAFTLPAEVAEALGRELASVALNRYPAADCGELRGCIAAIHDVDPSTLCFGNGSDELIALLLSAFSEPRAGAKRATALYPVPTFSVYGLACVWTGVDAVELPLDGDMQLDASALERAVDEHRPNIAFFARPNNPTGTLWPADSVLRLAEEHPDMLVVNDEAYAGYTDESCSLVSEVARLPNLVVMRTLSKIGMAGLRIGYVHARPHVIDELEKLRPPYNIGALNQHAAVWLLENHHELLRAQCRRITEARRGLSAALARLPDVHVFDSEANLLLVRIGSAGSGRARALWKALAERGILVRNFDTGDAGNPLAGCLRITVGTPEENRLLLDAIDELLATPNR